jgi:hypothetical protein
MRFRLGAAVIWKIGGDRHVRWWRCRLLGVAWLVTIRRFRFSRTLDQQAASASA